MAKKKLLATRTREPAKNAVARQIAERGVAKPTEAEKINVRVRILESREAMLENAVISPAVTVGDLSVGSFFVLPKT